MNKNTTKIKDGIRALTGRPHEIISGTVVAGSIDESAFTMSVLPSDNSAVIEQVMLSTITDNDKGVILFPKDGSNVVIGSIDGPGEWILIRAAEITKINAKIGNVTYTMDATQVTIQNGDSLLNVGNAVFKMNTSSESLFQLLNDLITAIENMTSGGYPVDIKTPFINLGIRLNNLLSA